MSRAIFKVSVGFLTLALIFLAVALYLSDYYLDEQRRLAAAGDLAGALEKARTAEQFDPFSPEPLQAESFLLQQQGRNREAVDALEEAIDRDPHNYLPYLTLGNLQMFRMNDLDAAAESYRDVLRVNPNAAAARLALAQALLRAGDLEAAKQEYEKLRESGYITTRGLYDLGRIYVRTGEPEKGAQAIRVARRQVSAGLEEARGAEKVQLKGFIESMDLALADALVVQGKYAAARRIVEESESEQAPAILELLNTDPVGYRESVRTSAVY